MESDSRAQLLSSPDSPQQLQLFPPPQGYWAEPDKPEESGLNVSQFLSILRRRWLAIATVFGTITAATFFISSLSKPSYVAYIDVLPGTSTGENELLSAVSGTLESKTQGDGDSSSSSTSKDETMLNVLRSQKLLNPVIATLKIKYPGMKGKSPDLEYALFVRDLTVTKTQNTQIIHVEYKNSNPHKVKDVMSVLSKVYLGYSLQDRQKEVRQGLKFLERQLPGLEAQVDALEARLQGFRQQYNLVDPTTQGQQISSQKSTFAEQRLTAQAQLQQTQAIYADLQGQMALSPQWAAASPLTKGTRYQDVLNKMLAVDNKIAEEASLFRVETPNIKLLKDQKRNLAPLLEQERRGVLREVASQIREIQHQLKSINQAERTLNEQVKQYAVLSRYYDGLQRKLKIATDNLNEFLSKREALQIEVAQKEIPWQLLTPPTEPRVTSTLMLKMLLGATLGLLLGVGTAVLLDYWKRALYTVADIRGMTGVPVLETVPFDRSLKALAANRYGLRLRSSDSTGEGLFPVGDGRWVQQRNCAGFLEVFRSLYLNLRFLRPEQPIRSLVVTAAMAGAGASTVAIHLAMAAAAMGQRVLLVDANLRSPQLQRLLGIENHLGLANLITAEGDWDDAIQHLRLPMMRDSEGEGAMLAVLTTGSVPQEPACLLAHPRLQALKRSLHQAFDLVIYDAPPLADGVDCGLLATATDGLLMVVRLGHTTPTAFSLAAVRLKIAPVPWLAIVANAAKDYHPLFPFPNLTPPHTSIATG